VIRWRDSVWFIIPLTPHNRRIPGIAETSAAQIRDLNLPIEDLPGEIGCQTAEKVWSRPEPMAAMGSLYWVGRNS
jgi:hypothetical protein